MATLTALSAQRYYIGRHALFYRTEWDGVNNFFDGLTHIGTTEEELKVESNGEYSVLTIEPTGPAPIRRLFSGEAPTFELNLFPNKTNMALISPTGKASMGATRRREPPLYSLWLAPEELFLSANADGFQVPVAVTYSAGAFVKADAVEGNRALTAAEQYLADLSTIFWRVDFERLTPVHRDADGGKSITSVGATCQQDLTKPEGCQISLCVGELADFPTLVIETGS